MLEADVHQKRFFQGLIVERELRVVDDPTLKQGYGSFTWDDEGVKARKKVLLHGDVVNLLHTRLTASSSRDPGNAHGIIRMPRPMVSNVFMNHSDWEETEMVEDTREGFYAKGVIRAECDVSDGSFELTPELSYSIKHRRIGEPVKHLKIMGNIIDLTQRVDAIGKKILLRPSSEKGFCISEGGPLIRINGALCF
jgi:TldD protein